jgi:hypothetical protein
VTGDSDRAYGQTGVEEAGLHRLDVADAELTQLAAPDVR